MDLFANTTELQLAQALNSTFEDILLQHGFAHKSIIVKRDEPSFAQTVFQVKWDNFALNSTSSILSFTFQYSPPKRKCRNTSSLGVASGSNALSYMSFVAAVITLVLNINNNINANNNNLNRVNLNYGSNKNTLTNLNQNVGNNFNLMFPPGKKKRRKKRSTQVQSVDDLFQELTVLGQKVVQGSDLKNTWFVGSTTYSKLLIFLGFFDFS